MSERRTVYLLHGLLGSGHGHFAHQIGAWHGRFRTLPIDLPGHGKCRLDAGPGYFDIAVDYVLALLDRFGQGDLVAASYLGGTVAIRCLRAAGASVRSLTLTGFVPGAPAAAVIGWARGFELLADRSPELLEQYQRMHGPRWRDSVRAVTADLETRYASELCVPQGTVTASGAPVLVLNGSVKSDEREAALAANRVYGSGATGLVLDGAGHIAGHDRPAEFNAAVEEFWDRIGASDRRRDVEHEGVRR